MKRNFPHVLGSLLMALSVLFFCGTSFAGQQQRFEDNRHLKSHDYPAGNITHNGHGLKAVLPSSGMMRKAPADNPDFTDVITEVEGTVQFMRKACAGYFMFWGTSLTPYEDILSCEVVYGDNNEVYFPNILSKLATGYDSTFKSYVKGSIEGDKVVINLPQTVMLIEEDGVLDGLNLYVVDMSEIPSESPEDEKQYTYECNKEKTSVYFTIGEDGSLTLEDLGGNSVLGLVYGSNDTWAGYGDLYQVYTPFNAKEATMPEGVKAETYGYTGDYSAYLDYADFTGYFTNIAIDGETLYIQGLFSQCPDAVITAQLDGDVAHISQDQFVFIYADKYFMTTKILVDSVYIDENGEEQHEYALADPKMTYDLRINRDTKEITSVNPDICLVVNAYDDSVFYMEALKDFTMRYQDNADGVPMNPQMVEFVESREYTGFDTLCFAPCNLSDEGKVLVDYEMYYRIFINDELTEFKLLENDDITVTEIPMFFNNYNDLFYISGGKIEVGIYPEDVTTVGVQFLYVHNEVETESEVITINVDPSGVDSIDMNAEDTEYFDLSGLRVSNPRKGIFVKRSVMPDGSVRNSKVIVK